MNMDLLRLLANIRAGLLKIPNNFVFYLIILKLEIRKVEFRKPTGLICAFHHNIIDYQ
jgi:hypothetical protein